MSDFIDVVRRLLCRRYVAASVVFGLCALTGVAWVLCEPGTLGHHWDWLIPDSPEELRALTRSNFYAWQDFALGSFVSYRYNSTLLAIVLGLPGYLGASGALVSKGLVICTLMGSALTMYALVEALVRRLKPDLEPHRYAMVAGILYGFSPFSYNQIVAGDQLEFIAYAIAPLCLLFILRSVEGFAPARVRSMVAAAVCLTVMSASPQTLVLSVLTGLVIVAALNPSLKHVAATMGIILVFTIALCSYWIIPVAFGGDAISEGVATTAQAFADTGLRSMSSLFQTLTTAAEPGSFYLRALPGPLSATFTIAWIMLWVVIATATLLHRHRLVVALAILYVIGSILPLGGAPLVGPVVLGLYHATMPASLLFRTAQHLVFLPTLVAPLLVGICSASVELLNNRFRQIAAVLVLLAVSAGFVVHSDYLALIGPFKKDSNARAATHYVASVAKDQRMLFLPASGSYYFHPGVFDYFFEGGDDPSVRFSPVPTLAPGYKWSPYLRSQVLEKAIDELMLQGGRIDDRELLLKISSIGFVEALNGVHPAGGVFVDSFNYAHAVHTVGQLPRLRMRSDDAEETLWEVQGSVPRIYVPDCVVRVDQRADAYDLLPWSRLVKKCDAPAFIADEPSDEIIKRASDIRALVEGKGDRWHFGQIGVQLGFEPVGGNSDVEVDRMLDGTSIAKVFAARHYVIVGNLVPAGAFSAAGDPNLTRLDLGLNLPDTGDYLISLLAPDWAHRFEARVTLQAGEQFLIIAPTHLEQVGHPDPRRITQLRLANITPHHLSLRVAKILPPVLYRASTGAAVEPGNAPARLGYLAAVPVVPTFRGASMTPTLAGDGSVTEEVSSRGLVFEGDVHGPDHAMRFGPGQLRTLLAIDAPVPAEYLVSFLAPDWNHRFDARVVVPAGPAKFSLAPGIMDQVGSPRVSRIAVFRVANITAIPAGTTVVMEPPVFYRSQWVLSAAVLETIAQPTYNRWDAYYFGYLQQRPAIRDSLQFRTDGATLYFEATWPGEYDIYLRLETGPTIEPVAVSVDGDAYECKDPRSPTDRTEDVIAVNQKWLQAGMHTVQLARCLSGRAVGKLAVFGIDVVPVVFLVPAEDRPTIVDLKQAPGSFRVALKGGDPTYLVLNDAYDNRWVARQNGEILAHRLANGYANAWFIKNPQAGSVDVYFAPQGLLNIGYATSAGAFGILLILGVFVGRSWHRRQLS